jgi:hypothetical protein
MAVRDWAVVDYYDVLGVRPGATDDEIARAFRTLAKQHHPDAAADVAASERFTDIVAAYEVLSDPRQRYDYDDVRASVASIDPIRDAAPASAPGTAATGKVQLIRWTPAKAVAAIIAGVLCFVLGVLCSIYILHVEASDRADRVGRVRVTALAAQDASGATVLDFETTDGQKVTVPEPNLANPHPVPPGSTLTLLYRPTQPTNVIVDESHFARDITYWIVAVKLLICAPIIVVIGVRKRRALRRM